MKTIMSMIQSAMYDLMQRNTRCSYLVKSQNGDESLKNVYALDAYMHTYQTAVETQGDAYCFMAPSGKPAVEAVFKVVDKKILLSGCVIVQDIDNPYNTK